MAMTLVLGGPKPISWTAASGGGLEELQLRSASCNEGNVGRIALNHLISDPRFVIGFGCRADAKVAGRGELAGLDVSPCPTNDLDAPLATEPDCAVYCAMGDNRIPGGAHCRRMLAAISSALPAFPVPWG
jgi:hypothetical protein